MENKPLSQVTPTEAQVKSNYNTPMADMVMHEFERVKGADSHAEQLVALSRLAAVSEIYMEWAESTYEELCKNAPQASLPDNVIQFPKGRRGSNV